MADSTCASEPGVSPLKNSHPGVSASGQMAFTRIPTRPHSNAVTRVSTRIASFAIAYPLIAGWGRIDEPELRLITHPRLARSASWAACITRKVPIGPDCHIEFMSSSVILRTDLYTSDCALFTTMSR